VIIISAHYYNTSLVGMTSHTKTRKLFDKNNHRASVGGRVIFYDSRINTGFTAWSCEAVLTIWL